MRPVLPPTLHYLVLLTLTMRLLSAAVQKTEKIVLTDVAGHIHSPNYPNDYPPNSDLQWLMATSRGRRFRVDLQEFVLERFHDLLQFFNGLGADQQEKPFAEITGRCTKSNPDECLHADIISSRNIVRVRFISDHSYQYRGFNLSYSVV